MRIILILQTTKFKFRKIIEVDQTIKSQGQAGMEDNFSKSWVLWTHISHKVPP